jgi:hypothetical protein
MERAYAPRGLSVDFLSSPIFWSSILQVKKDLIHDTIYQIHAGNSYIWSILWRFVWESIHDHLILPVTTYPLPNVVPDLWIPNTHS